MMNSKALLNNIQHDIVTVSLIDKNLKKLMSISRRYQSSAPTDDYYNTMILIETMKDINSDIEEMLLAMYKRRTALGKASIEESDRVVEIAEEKYKDIY